MPRRRNAAHFQASPRTCDVVDAAIRHAGSAFAAVNAIAKRARQLNNGVPPLVTNADPEKPAMTALREIAAGVVAVRNGSRRTRTEA